MKQTDSHTDHMRSQTLLNYIGNCLKRVILKLNILYQFVAIPQGRAGKADRQTVS